MTEPLYVRAICPDDIEPDQLTSRQWATNYSPWYIGHEDEHQLVDEVLDHLFVEWVEQADWIPTAQEAMCEFEDFTDWLEERGYKCFYTAGNVWMPEEEK